MDLGELMGCTTDISPIKQAWLAGDWDTVDAHVKTYEKDAKIDSFGLLRAINFTKEDVNLADCDYSKRWVDLALSQNIDTIQTAYIMNLIGTNITDKMHFNYCKDTVRKSERYTKWAKLVENNVDKLILFALTKIYPISERIAVEYYDELQDLDLIDDWKRKNKGYLISLIPDTIKTKKDQQELEKTVSKW